MKIATTGRREISYETIKLFLKNGYETLLIITSKEAPEYIKTSKYLELGSKIVKIRLELE